MGKEKARSFSGKQGEDAADWLLHYGRVAEVNEWITDEKRTKHVALSLVGEAEGWYNANHTRFERADAKWADFAREFKERFEPTLYRSNLEEQLLNVVQRERENVRSYYERSMLLQERLGNDGIPASILRTRWIRGLRASSPEIRQT